MSSELVDLFFTAFHILVMLFVLIFAVRRIVFGERKMKLVYFAFGMTSFLLSDLYWLVYGVVRPGTRMPFAANEIAEWAMFLMFAASLDAAVPKPRRLPPGKMLAAAIFTLGNTLLWIGWSGEWVQDVLTGVCVGYLLCMIVACLAQTGTLRKAEWILWGLLCAILLAAQAGTFYGPEELRQPLDTFCYILLFVCLAVLFLRALALRKTAFPEKSCSLSFAVFAWTILTMYMSAGMWYNFALAADALSFPMMYTALGREAA